MLKDKLTKAEKDIELIKYRDLNLATLDYILEHDVVSMKAEGLDLSDYYNSLKPQTITHFEKGRLTTLKQWFRDLTEMAIENLDLKFNDYLQNKTGYDIDIFKSYFVRIEKIIEKGKITTDNQYYEVNIMVDQLCQSETIDSEKVNNLNLLLTNYAKRKLNN